MIRENYFKNLDLVQNFTKFLNKIIFILDEREIKKIDTQEEIAKLSGVSPDTISNVEKNQKQPHGHFFEALWINS